MVSLANALEEFKSISSAMLSDLHAYLEPYATILPDARFRETLHTFVPGMVAARSPQITKAAAHAPEQSGDSWALTKRIYRMMKSPRYSHRDWTGCLYADARRIASEAATDRIIVALDPVNFEKAYAQKIEGISQVYKSTPPGSVPNQDARITNGYPSIIAQIVNTPQIALPYAHLFSYMTEDFLSENQELKRAMRTIRTVLRGLPVCVVADAGLDARKLFRYAATCDLTFVIRAKSERTIEVYNHREDRWEPEKLLSLAETYPGRHRFKTVFTHAGDTITAQVCLDWLRFRIPATGQCLWAVVATTTKVASNSQDTAAAQWLQAFPNPLVLLTNRPVQQAERAQQVYADWRLRPGIEHLNRFIQEDGVDIEKIQLRTLERFRRQFTRVLAIALFVLRLPDVWHPVVVHWPARDRLRVLRQLGSAVAGTAGDRGGPYLLLRGVQRILDALSVLVTCATHPPPSDLLFKARVPT